MTFPNRKNYCARTGQLIKVHDKSGGVYIKKRMNGAPQGDMYNGAEADNIVEMDIDHLRLCDVMERLICKEYEQEQLSMPRPYIQGNFSGVPSEELSDDFFELDFDWLDTADLRNAAVVEIVTSANACVSLLEKRYHQYRTKYTKMNNEAIGLNTDIYRSILETINKRAMELMTAIRASSARKMRRIKNPSAADSSELSRRKGTRRKLPPRVVEVLNEWFHEHESKPYPTEEDKAILMRKTGLQYQQLCNWFGNKRGKMKRQYYKENVDNYSYNM